jgi:hypothetical protein
MTYPGLPGADAAALSPLDGDDLLAALPEAETLDIASPDAVAAALTEGRIDDILFDAPAPVVPPPPAEGKPQLQLVAADAANGFAKAKSGEALTADEAAAAMDALKAMSVEDRTKLFS